LIVDVAELGTMLTIWAHPDDETFLAGGVMAMAAANGQRVTCVSATNGEHGTNDSEAWPPERLGRLRRWESTAAMAILDVQDHRWLDFDDGRLGDIPRTLGIETIGAILEETAPDTVITFGPDGMTFHQDHIAIGSWVTEAWQRLKPDVGCRPRLLHPAVERSHYVPFRERLIEMGIYMTDDRPVPRELDELAVHVELDECRLDQKIAALSAMYSQVQPAIAELGLEEFRILYGTESFVDHAVVGRTRGSASTT
jgi:LmbE family N-acetylglucosaminyl deacetylase